MIVQCDGRRKLGVALPLLLLFSFFANQVLGTVGFCQTSIWLNVSSTYMLETPPIDGDNDFVTVYQQMWLIDIVGLVEPEETLVTSWLSSIIWHDKRLTWDPSLFNNCTYMNIPGSLLYLPDIDILNPHDIFSNTRMFDRKNRINVYYNGTVEWFSFGVFSTSCSLDLTYYPFDYQTCYVDVSSLSLLTQNMRMRASHEHSFSVDEYRSNDLWNLVQTKVMNYSVMGNEIIRYYLLLRRRPFYSLINIATPIIILSVLALGVFWLPAKADEKMSLSVTIFLSSMILSAVIVTSLPASSTTYPLLAIFSMFSTMYAAGAVIATCAVLNVHHRASQRGSSSPPLRLIKCLRAVDRLFCLFRPCPCCLRNKSQTISLTSSTATTSVMNPIFVRTEGGSSGVGANGGTSGVRADEDIANTSQALHNSRHVTLQSEGVNGGSMSPDTGLPIESLVLATSQNVSNTSNNLDVGIGRATEATVRTDEDLEKWQNVAIMLDRIFFWFFFVSISIALVACFVIVPALNISPQLD